MTGVILAAHGTMAFSALELAEMLTGEKERVECIGFQAGDSLENLLERFQAAIDALGTENGILILTDLKGGSPCNAATLMQKTRENIRTVYGFSIPMLLQAFEGREETDDLDELAEGVLEVGAFAMGKISFS
ncbi:PTS system fructose IIA component [Pseudoflavonifractor capillosus ATCC 29799]|uniref:PTS system fructose IIA component n=1 Tax=Pseudoflavonifractor capillosus ATCC 29799 TaxID=411467 RepID=A6NZC7_9FIRM|nr:PTS sugar transporter subunit IIA [Pseudoflavonifractor capillosus]EDM98776.1 PTS system fructose IIA component [Pseudoflavonifractor capillosus ATCC 29799]